MCYHSPDLLEEKATELKMWALLDIAYLTIHVDAGAMAFTRRKYMPLRLAAKTCHRMTNAIGIAPGKKSP